MLERIINRYKPATPVLPICHITTWHSCESIMKQGEMIIDQKEGRENLYFFYGSPFYRLPSNWNGQRFRRPIGLLFNSKLIDDANKIYPFDSGAFEDRFKDDYFPKDFSLETFELKPGKQDTPGRLVSLLYKNNEQYLFGEPNNDFPTEETIVDCIMNLITSKDRNDFDARNHGIEIVFSKDIKLKGMLELVLLPKTVFSMNKNCFCEEIDSFKLDFYEDSYRFDPAEDCSKIQVKAKEYLRAMGLIG